MPPLFGPMVPPSMSLRRGLLRERQCKRRLVHGLLTMQYCGYSIVLLPGK